MLNRLAVDFDPFGRGGPVTADAPQKEAHWADQLVVPLLGPAAQELELWPYSSVGLAPRRQLVAICRCPPRRRYTFPSWSRTTKTAQ